ncbi:MAG TPA: hypothetical protein VK469_07955 [Candidatus Kapabacteria bacterium]|nr:hypothetical protein [Candidatus Kapabacteria bacterium]
MKNILIYELDRIKKNEHLIFYPPLFLVLSLLFIFFGSRSYLDQKNKLLDFIEHEVAKVSGYANYDQYGGYGYRIKAIPSALEVFFKSQTEVHESKVDTLEIIDISSSKRGKNSIKIYFEGFAGFVFFWGGILQLYLGLSVFKSKKNLKLHKRMKTAWQTVVVRFSISICFFVIQFGMAYGLAQVFLKFTQDDLKGFIVFTIIFLTLMALFFLIGLLIFFIAQKKNHLKYAVIFWAILVLAPEFINGILDSDTGQIPSMYKMNVTKLKSAKEADIESSKTIFAQLAENKKSKDEIYKTEIPKYLNSYYEKNKAMENDFINIEKINAYRKEMISSFIPTYNYFFQTNEIIGGYNSYFEFLAHVLKTKEKFADWYIQKKFFERAKTVEPFASGNGYIFEMKPIIPNYFFRSLIVSVLIAFGLLIGINTYLRKIFRTKNDQGGLENKPGFYFKLMEKEIERENCLSNYYGKKIVCIDNIESPDIDRDIGLKAFLNWLIHLRGVNPAEVNEKLKLFALDTESTRRLSGDDIKRVYLAVMLSSADSFLMNNNGKHMSNKFERQFLEVLSGLCKNGKTILYLGSEPLESRQKKAFFDNRQNQDFVPVDIDKISLR